MNLHRLAALLLLALPLAACASSEKTQAADATSTTVEVGVPEVRYYVIADT